jgi:hypothetical protein
VGGFEKIFLMEKVNVNDTRTRSATRAERIVGFIDVHLSFGKL